MRTTAIVPVLTALLVGRALAGPATEPAVSASERVLLACTEAQAGPNELKLDCPSLQLRASGDAASELEANLLDATVAMLEKRGARVERTTTLLAGSVRKTLRWSADAQRGLLLYVPVSASRIRMLSCEASELPSCTPFLEAFAARLARMPLPTTKIDDRPKVAGRVLTVPADCTTTMTGPRRELRCGGTTLSWATMPPEMSAGTFATIVEVLRKQFAGQADVKEARLPCRLDEVATECRSFRVTLDGKALSSTVAWAVVRGAPILATCTVRSGTSPELFPSPCDQVLRLDVARTK